MEDGAMNKVSFNTVLFATLVAGTLDILSAFVFAGMGGITPGQVLRYVASGPFGDTMRSGGLGAATAGLLVHYGLMLVMVMVFAKAFERVHLLRNHWYAWGAAYGIAIYLVMYWVVVPTRFGTVPKTDLWSVGNALFSHIVCVGLPMAFILTRRDPSKTSLA
jgi:hypothetical protein